MEETPEKTTSHAQRLAKWESRSTFAGCGGTICLGSALLLVFYNILVDPAGETWTVGEAILGLLATSALCFCVYYWFNLRWKKELLRHS